MYYNKNQKSSIELKEETPQVAKEENLKYYRCPLDKPCDLDYLFPEKITL